MLVVLVQLAEGPHSLKYSEVDLFPTVYVARKLPGH